MRMAIRAVAARRGVDAAQEPQALRARAQDEGDGRGAGGPLRGEAARVGQVVVALQGHLGDAGAAEERLQGGPAGGGQGGGEDAAVQGEGDLRLRDTAQAPRQLVVHDEAQAQGAEDLRRGLVDGDGDRHHLHHAAGVRAEGDGLAAGQGIAHGRADPVSRPRWPPRPAPPLRGRVTTNRSERTRAR